MYREGIITDMRFTSYEPTSFEADTEILKREGKKMMKEPVYGQCPDCGASVVMPMRHSMWCPNYVPPPGDAPIDYAVAELNEEQRKQIEQSKRKDNLIAVKYEVELVFAVPEGTKNDVAERAFRDAVCNGKIAFDDLAPHPSFMETSLITSESDLPGDWERACLPYPVLGADSEKTIFQYFASKPFVLKYQWNYRTSPKMLWKTTHLMTDAQFEEFKKCHTYIEHVKVWNSEYKDFKNEEE
jgi:hypothetical protein